MNPIDLLMLTIISSFVVIVGAFVADVLLPMAMDQCRSIPLRVAAGATIILVCAVSVLLSHLGFSWPLSS
jgi:hypothetical protein